MNRNFLFLLAAISIFGFLGHSIIKAEDRDSSIQITTQEQAAEFASKLANEKCNETFAKSPFSPDSYEARLVEARWYWGKIEPPGIHSYSAEIEFNVDGSDRKVRVVFHTDVLGNRIERFKKKK